MVIQLGQDSDDSDSDKEEHKPDLRERGGFFGSLDMMIKQARQSAVEVLTLFDLYLIMFVVITMVILIMIQQILHDGRTYCVDMPSHDCDAFHL